MSADRKGELISSAEYICIAANQIGLTYSTNEYGSGPRVSVVEDWGQHEYVYWRDPAFLQWLQCKDVGYGIVIGRPKANCALVNLSKNEILVEFVRMLWPSLDDYDEYAKRCGFATPEEAIARYGELSWVNDSKYTVVKGTEVREFLYIAVPQCWKDNVYYCEE